MRSGRRRGFEPSRGSFGSLRRTRCRSRPPRREHFRAGPKPPSMASATGSGRPQPLQDAYLAEVKRQAVPVTIFLVNGFQLKGVVKGFDPSTIVLEYEKKAHLIYKHAVSTISPNGPVSASLVPDDGEAVAP